MFKRFSNRLKNRNQANKIIMKSNVVQYDGMGYPLRLVMIESGDGTVNHIWRDIAIDDLKETDVELKWTKV